MFKAEDIRSIHMEITSRCNAACPMCARNVLGGEDNPHLPLTEIRITDFNRIFAGAEGLAFLQRLDKLFMCGNYGDPIAAKDTMMIMDRVRSVNPKIRLGLNTNGSAKDSYWWFQLGDILKHEGDYCKFSIDGLADTNHLYRRNTNFDKIIENAKAFIQGGGQAHWDYIVFRHNEHQVEEARALAKKLGFKRFQVKKTGRFFSNTKMQGKDEQVVHNRDGSVSHVLEKPLNPEYQNSALLKEAELVQQFGSMDAYLDQTPIHCKTLAEKSVYLSAEGLVFPCCWTANQMYVWYMEKEAAPIWDVIREVGGKEAIDAREHGISAVINGKLFQAIQERWGRGSCADGKLKVCAKTCGTGFDAFGAQFK